jgi:hypothetical protein
MIDRDGAAWETLYIYTPYSYSLAQLIGCWPRFRDYVLEPKLAYRPLAGSNIDATYWLRGPRAQPELAKTQIYHLPLVLTPFQTAGLAALCVLRWIGLLREAPHRQSGSILRPTHTAAGAASLI